MIAALFILALPVFNTVHSEEKKTEKAIIATSEKEGIKLSEIALKTIDVKTEKIISTQATLQIQTSSLVYSLDQVGVYRFRNGWIKFVPVEVLKKSNLTTINTPELQTGDSIVVQGMPLLRAAEMEAFQGEEE